MGGELRQSGAGRHSDNADGAAADGFRPYFAADFQQAAAGGNVFAEYIRHQCGTVVARVRGGGGRDRFSAHVPECPRGVRTDRRKHDLRRKNARPVGGTDLSQTRAAKRGAGTSVRRGSDIRARDGRVRRDVDARRQYSGADRDGIAEDRDGRAGRRLSDSGRLGRDCVGNCFRDHCADESDFDPGDYVMGGNQTVVSSRPVKSGRKAMPGSDMANMRLPRSLLNIIKTEFPSASNQDALAAYILVKSGEDVSVSPTVDILVENYKGDKTVQNIDKRVEHMEKQLNEMRTMLNEVLLAVSYLVFDRVGFRNENPSDPRSINFVENGMADLQQRLSEQSVQLKQYKDRKKGRPLR